MIERKGFYKTPENRSVAALLALWLLAALLSACGESAVVSQVSGAEDSLISDQLPDTIADTAIADDPDDVVDPSLETVGAVATDGSSIHKIMAVGDSITHGFGGATSYRKPLLDLLQLSGCEFEMVGSMTENLPDTGFQSPHEAYSGHRTDSFLTGHQSSFGDNPGISESMIQFAPRLVLLNLGANDMNQNRNVDDVIANIDQIVALIFDAEPQAQVVVATLVPYFNSTDPDDPVNVRLERLSTALQAWFLQAAHPAVYLVDIREGFTSDMMQSDLIHPNTLGDAFIAGKFHQSVTENNLCP